MAMFYVVGVYCKRFYIFPKIHLNYPYPTCCLNFIGDKKASAAEC